MSQVSAGPGVDKRGVAPPPRGPAFRAAQAREALGIRPAVARVADLPAPLFHTLVAAAVVSVAVLVRPQRVGMSTSIVLDGSLAAVIAIALIYYDSTTARAAGAGAGPQAAVLPCAALLSLATALAGQADPVLDLVLLAVTATVIATAPHLDALRRLGREGWTARVGRQVAGVTIVLPVLVAGVSFGLTPAGRAVVAALGVALVTYDGIRLEDVGRARALLAAVGCALVIGLLCLPAPGTNHGTRAAALLIVWYGLRGLAAAAAQRRLTRATVLEYGVFTMVAVIALEYVRQL
ncbi:MAG: hypothetical protein ABR541_04915 [Candidatus Dormibacteria bacterium]